MDFEKKLAEKSVAVLMDKAQDCFDVAKDQHKAADEQHEAADKQHEAADKQHEAADKQREIADRQDNTADILDTMGNALVDDAVDLKGELELDANRTSPRMRLREPPNCVPPTAESLPKTIPRS